VLEASGAHEGRTGRHHLRVICQAAGMTTPAPAFPHAPPQWAGAAVMAGYALALAATGIVQTRRRDVS
jgi:hypothetical protein